MTLRAVVEAGRIRRPDLLTRLQQRRRDFYQGTLSKNLRNLAAWGLVSVGREAGATGLMVAALPAGAKEIAVYPDIAT